MKRPPPLTTPRPPRTRRPAVRTPLLFLLLLVAGAAVNVAVAWAFASTFRPSRADEVWRGWVRWESGGRNRSFIYFERAGWVQLMSSNLPEPWVPEKPNY